MPENDDSENTIATPGLYETSSLFCEQALGPNGESGFAIHYYMDNEVKFEQNYLFEGVNYVPIDRPFWRLARFSKDKWIVPSFISQQAVFELVKEFVHDFVELPHAILEDVLAAWIVASYIPEKFNSVPYLIFVGPKDSGKTRALEVLQQLSYRAVLSPSLSNASIYRVIEKFHPTLCLDEAEIYGNEARVEAIALLNAGYRRGQYIFRISQVKPDDIDSFDCFGFKGLASTEIFVSTLESRGVIINMRRNTRDIHLRIDEERAGELRLLLLIYRFNILYGTKPIMTDEKQILEYLPIKNGRIAELFFPLIAVCPNEEVRQRVKEYAKEVYGKRLEDEKSSREAELTEILLDLKDKVEAGKLSIALITDRFNLGKPEKQHWKPESIGRWLKKLGFQKTRIAKGYMAIFYDQEILGYLAQRYSEKPSQPSLPSLTMETSNTIKGEGSERSDGSSELFIRDLASVYWKDEALTEKKCGICGYVRSTVWEAVTHKAQVIAICEECAQAFQNEQEVKA